MVTALSNSIPEWLARLYPFEPNTHQLPSGPRLNYVDHGAGEPVLMLHGNPTWSFFYRNLIEDLANNGFRCIAPDHIGCGLSDKPQDYRYRLDQHIANVGSLADALGLDSFHLVVHDWGGAIGCGLAVQDPGRIRSLSILNTAAFRSSRIPLRIAACRLPWLGEFMVRGFNAFAGAATFMAVTHPMPRDIKRGFLFPYDSWGNRIATHRFVLDIPMSPSHPSWDRLKGIENQLLTLSHLPIQFNWGMKDWCFSPEFLKRWKDIFPSAFVHEFQKAGHYLLEDSREEVIGGIRSFLEGVRASS
jgi:pimeloyl-ACP methyl ester carboxylesterase